MRLQRCVQRCATESVCSLVGRAASGELLLPNGCAGRSTTAASKLSSDRYARNARTARARLEHHILLAFGLVRLPREREPYKSLYRLLSTSSELLRGVLAQLSNLPWASQAKLQRVTNRLHRSLVNVALQAVGTRAITLLVAIASYKQQLQQVQHTVEHSIACSSTPSPRPHQSRHGILQ